MLRAFRKRVVVVLAFLALSATHAQGLLLYDNGPVSDVAADGRCDSGPSPSCGGSGDWTFYDNFILASDASVTGFDYTDFFFPGSPADYIETAWSLFDADPFTSAPIASGTAVAVLTATGTTDQFLFELSGLGVGLSAGIEYWLGIHNSVTGDRVTTVARVGNPGGGLDAAKHSDGGANDFDFSAFENRAFRVRGSVVPEASTGLLLGSGLTLLAAAGRRARRL